MNINAQTAAAVPNTIPTRPAMLTRIELELEPDDSSCSGSGAAVSFILSALSSQDAFRFVGSSNRTGHLLPPHTDHSRWSCGLHVRPQLLGCTKKSKSPQLAIIHGTVSAYRSTGTKMAKLGATNGAALRPPPAPVSSTANAHSVERLKMLPSSHGGTSR